MTYVLLTLLDGYSQLSLSHNLAKICGQYQSGRRNIVFYEYHEIKWSMSHITRGVGIPFL